MTTILTVIGTITVSYYITKAVVWLDTPRRTGYERKVSA